MGCVASRIQWPASPLGAVIFPPMCVRITWPPSILATLCLPKFPVAGVGQEGDPILFEDGTPLLDENGNPLTW